MTDKKHDKKTLHPRWVELRDSGMFDSMFEKFDDAEKQFLEERGNTIAEAVAKLTDTLQKMMHDKEAYNELARLHGLPERE